MAGRPEQDQSGVLLPAGYLERARRLAAGELEVAPARPAATVVLLRDTATGLQVYLLRRVATMAFAAGMHVFPGGSVDAADAALPDSAWAGPGVAEWQRILSAEPGLARSLIAAAVRETFEESGVLLAGESEDRVVADLTGADWERERLALLARERSLAGLLAERRLVVRTDLLRAWAHWITPEVEERRYDTRFFLAALPAGQRTRDVGGESDRARWISPTEALAERAAGRLGMLPPTAFTLSELTCFATVAEALAAGTLRDVRPWLPRVVVDADTARLLLPHEEPGG
jgi:8-oxo-dGTP pyrophosphatase MutT (NUDIX family)